MCSLSCKSESIPFPKQSQSFKTRSSATLQKNHHHLCHRSPQCRTSSHRCPSKCWKPPPVQHRRLHCIPIAIGFPSSKFHTPFVISASISFTTNITFFPWNYMITTAEVSSWHFFIPIREILTSLYVTAWRDVLVEASITANLGNRINAWLNDSPYKY